MRGSSILAIAVLAWPGMSHAERKAEVHPHIGLDQTVIADLGGGDGTLSYTSAVVGIDAHVQGKRSELQANLAYQHQFSWNDRQPDQDVISGLVTARYDLMPRHLSIEGGALATRVRSDGIGGGDGSLGVPGAKSQIYSAYAGPTYRGAIGDVAVNAAYRLGYNRLEDGLDTGLSGVPGVSSFDESWTHLATISLGQQASESALPFGWAVGAGYEREDASELDQRFSDKWARLDITVPIGTDVAVVGGVGYEKITISNRDAVRDPATGEPIRDNGGRFVTDPASPRLLSYDQDGIIGDVGLLWRPSRRTSLTLTAGWRYGGESYTGSFTWQPDDDTSISLSLFDSVDSFGRSLSGGLANLPSQYVVTRNPFSGDIDPCAFGTGTGDACLTSNLTAIRSANFRNRGISASYAHRAGALNYGLGLGYARRKFLGEDPVFAGISGATDESYYAAATLGYAVDARSSLAANLYATQFNSGIEGIADSFSAGGYLNYSRRFTQRLQGTASLGVGTVKASGAESVVSGLAQIGVRYGL